MDDEVELICDGNGIAVLGQPDAVQRFLKAEGLESSPLGIPRPRSVLNAGAVVAQSASEIAANSGRWVKLTEQSAKAVQKHGLRKASGSGLSTGVLKGNKGQIKGFVEFATGPGTLLTNPAILAGAAGIMAQLAMQQAMNEVTDYLATIDAKVDDVLRSQRDTVLSRMIGVGLVIDEAMLLREARGRVDEVTWSKVQGSSAIIAETQVYALRQLDTIADSMGESRIGKLADSAKAAEGAVQEWLSVLARCFQLQDGIAVLELDRVLDASPDELDGHRIGLQAARQKRMDLIGQCTTRLLVQMNAAQETANAKRLLQPMHAGPVTHASTQAASATASFNTSLGLESTVASVEARWWTDVATEARDRALGAAGDGALAAKRFGIQTVGQAGSVPGKLTGGLSHRINRLREKPDVSDGREP